MKGANGNRRVLKSVTLKENENRRALKDIKNLVGVARVDCKKPLRDHKNAVVPRRPTTNKYTATLAIKSNTCHDEVKQKHEFDEKLHTINADIPIVEEPEQMDRIVDIDSCDSKNPLAVVEYVEDIYEYYRKIECPACVNPDYMFIQFDINEKMRAMLVDWLIELHYKFKLMDETLYLTVNIIDRFLSSQTVVRNKLQLIGITALLLACKYEEVSVPLVEDLIMITDHAYSREEVLSMEKLIMKTLKFDMSVPTPYVFMRRFLKAAESDRELELLSYYVVELCLLEYKMLKFKPSILAASAIFTAKCSLKGFKEWSKTCEVYTAYTEDRLMECSKMMVDLHRKSGTGKLVGVYKKYSSSKFGCTAKCKPALFLLDDDSISDL